MAKPYKRRLRNYLINTKYQLRYTLIMVLICTCLTTVLGYSWYDQMREASRAAVINALEKSESYADEVREELETYDLQRMFMLAGFGGILSLAIALFGILLTHKVAGPLVYLSNILSQISVGRLGELRALRDGDFLEDFYASFKEAHDALKNEAEVDLEAVRQVMNGIDTAREAMREDTEKDLEAVNEAIEAIKRGDLLADELVALQEMRERKELRLS